MACAGWPRAGQPPVPATADFPYLLLFLRRITTRTSFLTHVVCVSLDHHSCLYSSFSSSSFFFFRYFIFAVVGLFYKTIRDGGEGEGFHIRGPTQGEKDTYWIAYRCSAGQLKLLHVLSCIFLFLSLFAAFKEHVSRSLYFPPFSSSALFFFLPSLSLFFPHYPFL